MHNRRIAVIQWTLVITNYLGPEKLLCYIETLLYQGYKNNTIQRKFEIWDHTNYLWVCYISVCYNESPLYYCFTDLLCDHVINQILNKYFKKETNRSLYLLHYMSYIFLLYLCCVNYTFLFVLCCTCTWILYFIFEFHLRFVALGIILLYSGTSL